MKAVNNINELIGNTPIVKINKLGKGPELYAKLESFNPGGSVKDRIALGMIEDAEAKGVLLPGSVIIEPTSGNTGIGIAMVAAVKGYESILVMPESASIERRKIMSAYGARIVLTPAGEGMKGSIAEAERLLSENKNGVILQQFRNPANPASHYRTTAEEIFVAMDGKIDIFVAGVGTGGTISGTARRLRELLPEIRIIAVEPESSPVISGGDPGPHKIQGIGAGFIPDNLDRSLVSEVIKVKDKDAMETSRSLMRFEGILCGISSGAAAWAAIHAGSRSENEGKRILFLAPDTGERYLSTPLFEEK
ncbi:MAG: cysteine synthase A [Spirochaetales bacterium]|nr:cysteine synthase A [Spirochaetales bacterium]